MHRGTFLYDRDGNLLDDGVRTCTWDGAGRLAGVNLKTGSGTPPAGATGYAFAYNAAGQRVAESLNGATTRRGA